MRRWLIAVLLTLLAFLPILWAAQTKTSGPSKMVGPLTLPVGSSGGGGIALVNFATCAASSGGCTTTAANMVGATLCVVAMSWEYGGGTDTMSSSPANTWISLTPQNVPSNNGLTIFYAYSPSVSSSMTFTPGGLYAAPLAACFSGTTGSAVDQQNGTNLAAATSGQPGSVTPASNGELVFTAMSLATFSSQTCGNSSSYTQLTQIAPSGAYANCAAYLIQSTATATNPTLTWTTSSASALSIGTFK